MGTVFLKNLLSIRGLAFPILVPLAAALLFCVEFYQIHQDASQDLLSTETGRISFAQRGSTGPKWDTRYIGILIDTGSGPRPFNEPGQLTIEQHKELTGKTVAIKWAPVYEPILGKTYPRIYRLEADGRVWWTERDTAQYLRESRELGLTWLAYVCVIGLSLISANALYLTRSKGK